MKETTKNRIRYLVTFNKVTIFIAKLFFMISDFKNGKNVCLTFDRGRKFQVVSNIIIEGKIQVVYFNENTGKICETSVEPKYLTYSYVEVNAWKNLSQIHQTVLLESCKSTVCNSQNNFLYLPIP